jgi:small GTP-binding protein
MLNTSSPSPLFDEEYDSTSYDNAKKRNTSMITSNNPLSRPTLNKVNINSIERNDSNDDNMLNFVYEFKVILLGAIAVGKTSILSRYITNEFTTDHKCTIKNDYKIKIVNVNNTTQAKLSIWDTCGDEKYRAITRQYYKDAHGVLLVYDISDRNTFDNIDLWVEDIKNCAPADCVVTLVANKSDLNDKRTVTYQEGKNKATQLGFLFNEVSAKTGDNIFLLFGNISEAILEQFQKNKTEVIKEKKDIKYLDDLEFNNKREIKKEKKCC